jgi:hypothetical protein
MNIPISNIIGGTPICNLNFLENGLVMYIWLGSQVNPTFVQSLFGIQTASHIQPEKVIIVN